MNGHGESIALRLRGAEERRRRRWRTHAFAAHAELQ